MTVTFLVLLVSIAYLARLFASSSHRPTRSVMVFGVAALLSVLPNIVSSLNLVPLLMGYDYSVYGTVPFTVVLGYVVFFRGERDLAPIARNEIVDELDDALFGLDDAGQIIDFNAAARSLLPEGIEDPVGFQLETVLPELAAEATLPTDPEQDVTATHTTVVNGSRTHYSVAVSPIAERGTVAGYLLILRDVTTAESTRRELQRQNEQLESFATTVAHDLRNPLQVAHGTATLLRSELPDAHPADRHLSRVDDAVSRMDAVLSELQTLAKHAQSVTETQTVSVGEAVEAVETRLDGPSVVVSRDGTIGAEPARLESILESLLRHSATQGGSTVTVAVTDAGFTYEDDSLRISATEQEDVFAHDRTSRTDGAGLGLKIVRTEAEAQGWAVDIEPTEDGTGTASIAFFLGAWLGMVKITPISRDRLLATTEDGLIVVDDNGDVTDFNAVAERFFTAENPIGQPLSDTAPSVADALPPVGVSGASERTADGHPIEMTHSADGEEAVYSVEISSVTDRDTIHDYALLLREVTQRHEARAELRRQNEQLDDFASSISHHLRNPLQVASGQTEMARRELADGTPGAVDRVDDLERSLHRMETIIADLRTLAKQGKSVESTSFVRFSEVVSEAGAHVEDGEWSLTVERDGTIRADQGRLLSILENLVRNSIEHAGPDVAMTARLTDDGFVFRDDGPGIDADYDRLFEYGYTTSTDGTGLGLSIVKTMTESHGWDVHVDPERDGACFVITGAVTEPEPPRAYQ